MSSQPGIELAPAPAVHYLTLRLKAPAQAKPLLRLFAAMAADEGVIVGFGAPLVNALGGCIAGLRPFPALERPGGSVPTTQGDVWVCTRGADAGEALDRVLTIARGLPGGLEFVEDQPAFTYRGGRDLSGYEDGTENPKGADAAAAAFVAEGPLAGSSFCAAQRWIHDLDALARMPLAAQHAAMGRDRDTNVELADAPPSAHVKRAAQESFNPAAFMLRRSTPYGTAREHGLYFVAFGADLDRFERVMRRMVGEEDGVVDGLFGFSRPATGGYYWCPAVKEGRLDLTPMLPAGGIDAIPDVEVPLPTPA
ncbi:hypothetical protein LBMAG42_49200 [Deltaproteobacteria bacterium]|nr:hypothetical protein LBMAG42_49200 [Deltaproteobacteria bacterium]